MKTRITRELQRRYSCMQKKLSLPCDLIWYLHVQWKDYLDFDIGEEALHATFER